MLSVVTAGHEFQKLIRLRNDLLPKQTLEQTDIAYGSTTFQDIFSSVVSELQRSGLVRQSATQPLSTTAAGEVRLTRPLKRYLSSFSWKSTHFPLPCIWPRLCCRWGSSAYFGGVSYCVDGENLYFSWRQFPSPIHGMTSHDDLDRKAFCRHLYLSRIAYFSGPNHVGFLIKRLSGHIRRIRTHIGAMS